MTAQETVDLADADADAHPSGQSLAVTVTLMARSVKELVGIVETQQRQIEYANSVAAWLAETMLEIHRRVVTLEDNDYWRDPPPDPEESIWAKPVAEGEPVEVADILHVDPPGWPGRYL